MELIVYTKAFIAVLISVLCCGLWIIALVKFVKDFSEFSLNENLLISPHSNYIINCYHFYRSNFEK